MKKNLFLAALALVALASCTDSEFVGDNSPTNPNTGPGAEKAIVFNSGAKTVTRADHVGADAASMLNNKFIVGGFKGTYTDAQDLQNVTVATGKVFDNYIVQWGANTAGTTTSNTSDWEYVGITAAAPSGIAGNYQSIKYWDYSATQYDFIAYSTGDANIATSGTAAEAISANKVLVSAITPTTAKTSAYTLAGKAADLAKCYIADMVTIYKDGTDGTHYQDEVQLTFRSLAAKVRMAIYETVPGYSIKDVKFYTNNTTTLATGTTETKATLFTSGGEDAKNYFYTEGTYTVTFPTIGKTNVSASDYNKAHASFAVVGEGKTTIKEFGTLQLVGKDYREADATNYIGRTAATASFAGTTAPYYQIALPNEVGTVLELRVDYTLLSIDGSGEEIKVHGATAYVPAIFAAWKPNYAYTYIFKISDNTNGWTSTVDTDPTGLYPITFDAIVVDSEEHTQSTITTVATPSITTYQKGHDITKDEYTKPANADATDAKTNDAIYAQVIKDGVVKDDLEDSGKSFFYKITGNPSVYVGSEPANWPAGYYTDAACTTPVTASFSAGNYYRACTEADVMDALNIRTSGDATTVVGRNGVTLTPGASGTTDYTVTQIPGVDGNWITQYNNAGTPTNITAGMVAKLNPSAVGAYAYVYDYTDGTPATSNVITAVVLNSAPTDWNKDDNVYYTDAACTNKANFEFTTSVTLSTEPADWNSTHNVYFSNAACAESDRANYAFTSGIYYRNIFYKKYTNLNHTIAVKVIKVVTGS